MATNGKDVAKSARALKNAMGMKGAIKPGDLTMKAREIMSQPAKKPKAKLPSPNTLKGVALRGLI